MSFEKLITKVQQAEDALEAHERKMSADMRQFKASWRAGWTPGRIVIAGLVSGFLVGRAEPLRRVGRGGGVLQLITALSGMLASSSAQGAAKEAGDAADAAETTAAAADPAMAADAGLRASPPSPAAAALPSGTGTPFNRDGPRRPEPGAASPTPAEAATDVSEL